MIAPPIRENVILEPIICVECGCMFGVPCDTLNYRRKNRGTVYCPNGHANCWTESDADRLRNELIRTRAQLDQSKADAEYQKTRVKDVERQVIAAKGQITKIKNRVGNGVCPCCNRTFNNLQRHMQTEHPEFKKEEAQA